jgi:hypothetical protein
MLLRQGRGEITHVGRFLTCAWILPVPAAARADPCEGRLPGRAGETFAGIVRYVGDGDSLCVGNTAGPAPWIEVRLSDFDAAELHSRTGLHPTGLPVAAGGHSRPSATPENR